MKLRIPLVCGVVVALATFPSFWTDLGSAQAQPDIRSSQASSQAHKQPRPQMESIETRLEPLFTGWSVPEPVQALNTPWNELPSYISRDGLSLYFSRNNSVTSDDVYVVHRSALEADWGTPVKLPNGINTSASDRMASVSADGHSLYFTSERAGGVGGSDLYVSRRTNVDDDAGWQPPENLTTVNSPGFDGGASLLEVPYLGTQLYFACTPEPGGQPERADIYMSVLGPDGFEPPTRVAELSGPWMDRRPYVRHDGLEIYFVSDRSGPWAIYRSRRDSLSGPWSEPVAVIGPADLGDPHVLGVTTPVLSWDGTTLYVGVWDELTLNDNIFVSHRKKMLGEFFFH